MVAVQVQSNWRRGGTRRILGVVAFLGAAAGLVYGGASTFCFHTVDEKDMPPFSEPPGVGGVALFSTWPKNARPDAVIVLSGQTFGFVQPCGCSRPQMGGLERRANFMESLRKKGWRVAGADLGDIAPDRHPIGPSGIISSPEQTLLKYGATMNALRRMGYVAAGLGKTEFSAGLLKIVGEYSLQKEQPPYLLAGNVLDKDGKTPFPPPPGGKRPLIGLIEIADFNGLPVAIVGVVGKTIGEEAEKLDPQLSVKEANKWLKTAVDTLAAQPKKPAVHLLLYQGPADLAKLVAKDRPEFNVILCQSEESEPPQFPEFIDHPGGSKTMIVQVGHKGRYVGAVGVFQSAAGVELKYQLVPLGEEYITPNDPAAEKANRVLPILDEYALQVKKDNLLARIVQAPHSAQIQAGNLNLTYVGSEKCARCHLAEHVKWSATPHGHALDALEKIAKRPALRNFDPECVVCHTVGFGYKTGYENAEKTPVLKHVGCESCHGPGSGHVADDKDEKLLKLLSPWKQGKADRLPDIATIEKIGKLGPIERGQVPLPPAQQQAINAISTHCMKCHDTENDPHFDLFKYWPKVNHSGLAKK
jgi:hypothetical protein